MSSIAWKGPKMGLPKGTYQFRRLGLRDLRTLYEIWTQYQNDTTRRLRLSLTDLDDLEDVTKEQLGESLYALAIDAPDRAFEWIFSTLVPVANSGKEDFDKKTPPVLKAEDAEDENKIPIWFITTYFEKLLEHKDFDRFFTELVGLLRKDGPLRTKLKELRPPKAIGSGESSDQPDGPTNES